MLVKAKKAFISVNFGNVEAGRILETTEAKGKILISSGLAEVYTKPKVKESNFQSPVGANGLSSQADQASQQKTANSSKIGGAKKVTFRKSGKSR